MSLKDKVETTREDILSLISCAWTYGHTNQVISLFFVQMLGSVITDQEIEEYARDLESREGYGEEDYEEAVRRLREFRTHNKMSS